MNELKYLKRHYGESFMHLCREQFSTILEEEGLLTKIIESKFAHSKSLAEDLEGQEYDFKDYIYNLYQEIKNPELKNIKKQENTATELMKKAGYTLYPECKTNAEILDFKKYYAKDEELCTFRGERLQTCRVWFAVKDNVDEIRRRNFRKPERQDEYGTSVISIQFSKNNNSILSIKNRYNHSVPNCDATFSNNLDNIIPGLTNAFVNDFNLNYKFSSLPLELDNYVLAENGVRYRSNYEINNIHFCENNIIVNNGKVIKLNPSKFLLMDYHIIDFEKKQIYDFVSNNNSFVSTIPPLDKIEVTIIKGDRHKVTLFPKDGLPIKIDLNKNSCIVSYKDPNIQHVPNNFMENTYYLERLSLPNAETIENCCCYGNYDLAYLSLPKLKNMGDANFEDCGCLTHLKLPELTTMGSSNFNLVSSLKTLYLVKLKTMGNNNFTDIKNLELLHLPELEKMESQNFTYSEQLSELNLPKLREMIDMNFVSLDKLKTLNARNLEKMDSFNFRVTHNLQNINLANLKTVENQNFSNLENLQHLTLNNLEQMGQENFLNTNSLTKFSAQKLKSISHNNFANLAKLTILDLPCLEKMGSHNFHKCSDLKFLNMPSLRCMNNENFAYINQLQVANLESLESLDSLNFLASAEIKKINIGSLKKIGDGNFLNNVYVDKEIKKALTQNKNKNKNIDFQK